MSIPPPDAKSSFLAPGACHDLADCHMVMDAAYGHLSPEQLIQNARHWVEVCRKHRRNVSYLQTPHGNFYLKVSTLARKKDRRRFLFLPWRMKTEWRNLDRLRKKGLAAPQRVLFGQKGHFPCKAFFMLTEEIQGSELDFRDHRQMEKLAEFVAALHARNILHSDLHPGNILMDSSGSPVLIDVQEVYCLPWLPRWLKVKNLGQLWRHIQTCCGDNNKLSKFLESYNTINSTPISSSEVLQSVHHDQRRFHQSRSKRCCKSSTEFEVLKSSGGVQGYKLRGFQWGIEDCRQALELGQVIKNEKLVCFQGVCVKTEPRRVLHRDRCLRAWKMNRALAVRGISVPRGLAYFRDKNRNYFLTQYHEAGLTLNRYLSSLADHKEKSKVLRDLAAWVRLIHNLNLWQRDFKSSNVLVLEGKFMLVDFESVQVCKSMTHRKKMINLAQLNASLSNLITLKDRLFFFNIYFQGVSLTRDQRREIYQQIWKITRQKNTSLFDLDCDQLISSQTFTNYRISS